MINYGVAIKRVRSELGLKQSELAKKTGLSASYLSLVENGKAVPSLAALKDIAEAMDIPYELLAWEAIEPPESLTTDQIRTIHLAKSVTSDFLLSLKRRREQKKRNGRRT
jgi:transcriptional regulator with XRE-family HTH domain